MPVKGYFWLHYYLILSSLFYLPFCDEGLSFFHAVSTCPIFVICSLNNIQDSLFQCMCGQIFYTGGHMKLDEFLEGRTTFVIAILPHFPRFRLFFPRLRPFPRDFGCFPRDLNRFSRNFDRYLHEFFRFPTTFKPLSPRILPFPHDFGRFPMIPAFPRYFKRFPPRFRLFSLDFGNRPEQYVSTSAHVKKFSSAPHQEKLGISQQLSGPDQT